MLVIIARMDVMCRSTILRTYLDFQQQRLERMCWDKHDNKKNLPEKTDNNDKTTLTVMVGNNKG